MSQPERFDAWLNKRALGSFELPFDHALRVERNGWRLEVLEESTLEVSFVDGARQELALPRGSVLVASGDDLFLARNPSRQEEEKR